MQRVVSALALVTSVIAFLLFAGTGLFLAGVQQSGERGLGLALFVVAVVAFSAVVALAFAPPGFFRRGAGPVMGIGAGIVGAMPPAGIAVAAFTFAGIPLGSALPALDWALFAAGAIFAIGTAAILLLAYGRLPRPGDRVSRQPRAASPPPPATPSGTSKNHEDPLHAPLAPRAARTVVDDRRAAEGSRLRQA